MGLSPVLAAAVGSVQGLWPLASGGGRVAQGHLRQFKLILTHSVLISAGEGGPQTGTMTECFDCDNCKESLYGRKYIQMDNGPYCIPCYDAHFANTCDECKELIGHDCRVSRGPADKQVTSWGLWSPPHAGCTPRSCTTRTATTTSTASAASAATAPWLTSPSPARARSCCATTATAASSPPNASPVRRLSCQVGAGRPQHCSLVLVPWCQLRL